MARTKENLEFADRLKKALKQSAKPIDSPSKLALQFNLNHPGAQITNQAAQKWLVGDNKPATDKIETLAGMLGVSPQWLRFGVGPSRLNDKLSRQPVAYYPNPNTTETRLLEYFRLVTPQQQNLLVELLESMVSDSSSR